MAGWAQEIEALFRRFVAAQNARDEAALTPLLCEGPDFLWVTSSGATIWGRDRALARFRANWEKQWHLEPEFGALRAIAVTTDSALLHVPLLLTFAPLGEPATPEAVKWSGVFSRKAGGHDAGAWGIAAILVATVL